MDGTIVRRGLVGPRVVRCPVAAVADVVELTASISWVGPPETWLLFRGADGGTLMRSVVSTYPPDDVEPVSRRPGPTGRSGSSACSPRERSASRVPRALFTGRGRTTGSRSGSSPDRRPVRRGLRPCDRRRDPLRTQGEALVEPVGEVLGLCSSRSTTARRRNSRKRSASTPRAFARRPTTSFEAPGGFRARCGSGSPRTGWSCRRGPVRVPGLPISRSIVAPRGSVLTPGFCDQSDSFRCSRRADASLVSPVAPAQVDRPVLERLAPDGHASGDPDQIGVRELHPPLVAIVEEDVHARRVERARDPLGLLLQPRQRDHVYVVRGDARGPDDPLPSWCCSTTAAITRPGPMP